MGKIKKVALFGIGGDGWQGGIQYILNIMFALNEIVEPGTIEVHLFKHQSQRFKDIDTLRNIQLQVHDVDEVFEKYTLPNRARWFVQRKVMKRINPRIENYLIRNKFDFVFPANISTCDSKLNVASWIPDFQFHHYPNGASEEVIEGARRLILQMVNTANKIVLSSKFCEDDCLQLYPASKGKTHVLPFAVHIDEQIFKFSDFDSIANKYSIPRKFLMVANLFAPTKNHRTLFEALSMLRSSGKIIHLVCTGNLVDHRNLGFANEVLDMLTKFKIRDQVHLLGLIPREDQLALYRMAAALVQPSINEGWSTLVEEAKALGKRLILSDIELHKEQDPFNPRFFQSLNPADLAEKISETCFNEEDKPMPDLTAEINAYKNYQNDVKRFGYRFLEVASAN